MNNWLTPDLKIQIRKIFEPRYERKLSNAEILEIANNLTDLFEDIANHFTQKFEETNLQHSKSAKMRIDSN